MGSLHDCVRCFRVLGESSPEHDEFLFLSDSDSAGLAHGGLKIRLASLASMDISTPTAHVTPLPVVHTNPRRCGTPSRFMRRSIPS